MGKMDNMICSMIVDDSHMNPIEIAGPCAQCLLYCRVNIKTPQCYAVTSFPVVIVFQQTLTKDELIRFDANTQCQSNHGGNV